MVDVPGTNTCASEEMLCTVVTTAPLTEVLVVVLLANAPFAPSPSYLMAAAVMLDFRIDSLKLVTTVMMCVPLSKSDAAFPVTWAVADIAVVSEPPAPGTVAVATAEQVAEALNVAAIVAAVLVVFALLFAVVKVNVKSSVAAA